MSTAAAPAPTRCPRWCVVDVSQHAADLKDPSDASTFHRGTDVDVWIRDYHWSPNAVAVRLESYETADEAEVEELVIIDGSIGRGSMNLYELTVADAARLGNALLSAVSAARSPEGALS